jgi:transcriptional regulator with XRE-family HTH domain
MQTPPQKKKSKLQKERERRGWSRRFVAQQIGVSEYTTGQWERGEHLPYPEHIQKLCELFETNAEVLGLVSSTEDPIADERDSANPTTSLPVKRQRRLLYIIGGGVLILAVILSLIVYVIRPFSTSHIKPGGAWISPIGPTVGDIVHFAAYAYPTNNGDPQIDHVNFTAYWPGVDPRTWKIVCVARVPVRKDVYACDANLRLLGAPPGQIIISFDVYDRQGNANLAPNGKHRLMYLPGHSSIFRGYQDRAYDKIPSNQKCLSFLARDVVSVKVCPLCLRCMEKTELFIARLSTII